MKAGGRWSGGSVLGRGADTRSLYLQPGQVTVGTESRRIVTVLGACVAVCLVDRERSVAGMIHYVLPRGPQGSCSSRFGEVALPRLLAGMRAVGSTISALEARVFGGARILGAGEAGDVGQENVEVALGFLARHQIPVVDGHTGGTRGRKVVFHTADDVVWLRCL
jgi:chemotaxis protein CheD